jgi:TatD DNase family protein
MHAHIEPRITPTELERLGACVLAVTRSLAEFQEVVRRSDRSVAWGVGCHPGLARAIRNFSLDAFRAALASTPVVGEVGIDGSTKVPLEAQRAVFESVIRTMVETPRIVSVHSYRATEEVLSVIERHRPPGIVLHWWLGDEDATRRAVDLGACFSINASQARKWSALNAVPQDRLLTETDHPFGDRQESAPRRPGNISRVEDQLGNAIGLQPDEVRRLSWQNLGRLVDELRLYDLLPYQFQVQILAA